MAHTLDVKRLSDVFDELNENIHKLSHWEATVFLPSVFDQWDNGATLTDKQLEVLEQLYMKI